MNGDPEIAHAWADAALLKYIHNEKVEEAWDEIEKWYA